MIRTELILTVDQPINAETTVIPVSGVVPVDLVSLPADCMIVELTYGDYERVTLTGFTEDGAVVQRGENAKGWAGRTALALYSEEINSNQRIRVIGLLRKGVKQNARI